MTDKENFDTLKKEKKQRRQQIKLLKFLQADINRKLLFSSPQEKEEEFTGYLTQLREVELLLAKTRMNKFGSKFFEFIPSELRLQNVK